MKEGAREGGCLCGAVRFRAEGEPKWVAFCHCSSCRKHTGAPVSAFAGYERDRVAWTTTPLTIFASSPGVRRGYCAKCGSTLTYEGDRWPTEMHFHIGAFDDPANVIPTGHAFPEERLPWLHVSAEGDVR
jgi:hypothetical protein